LLLPPIKIFHLFLLYEIASSIQVDDGPKENENDHNSLAAPEPSTATLTPQPPSSSRGRKKVMLNQTSI
jgi:hypothetical protein